jgi:hypothetical protein
MHAAKKYVVRRLLVTANVPSSPILVTLMIEALSSFETLVLTRVTRRNIPEQAILHSHHRVNLKSYSSFWCFAIGVLTFLVTGSREEKRNYFLLIPHTCEQMAAAKRHKCS